jgi:hypothetical protein
MILYGTWTVIAAFEWAPHLTLSWARRILFTFTNPLLLGLILKLSFQTHYNLHAFLITSIFHHTYQFQPYSLIVKIFGEVNKLRSSSLCNFLLCLFTSCPLGWDMNFHS